MRYLICVISALYVCAVVGNILHEDVPFDLLNDDSVATEAHLRDALQPVNDAVQKIKIASTVFVALSAIPVIGAGAGAGAGIISGILGATAERDWKEGIYKYVSSEIDRSSLISDVHRIQAVLRTVNQFFNQMKEDTQEEQIKFKLNSMKKDFMTIANEMAHENALFRRYPQFWTPIFGSIAVSFQLFAPLYEKVFAEDASRLACRFQDLIRDYQELNVFYRLYSIHYKERYLITPDYFGVRDVQPDSGFTEKCKLEHNERGYNSTADIQCARGPCNDIALQKYCFNDDLSRLSYVALGHPYQCSRDYVALLRHRIERIYDISYDMLGNVCTAEVRNKQRKTGYGWLKLVFVDGHGIELPDGSYCDWPAINKCDLYVRVHIDDETVYNTKEIPNESDPTFYEMFTTRRLKKSSRMQLNLRDADDFGNDDSLVRVNGALYHLQGTQTFSFEKNHFTTIAYWRDEYKYEDTLLAANATEDVGFSLNQTELVIDGGIQKVHNTSVTDIAISMEKI